MRTASLLLLLTLAVGITASEGIATELGRYQATCAGLQKNRDESLVREKAKTVVNLVAIAKRDQGTGDIAAATPTWKMVIMLDAQNEEARKFLTGINQLDAALADATNRPDALLPAPDAPVAAPKTTGRKPSPIMADAPIMDISADRYTSLGRQRIGSVVLLQYVSGKWTSNIQAIPLQNPDRPDDLHPNNRTVLFQNNPVNAKFGKDAASFLFEIQGSTLSEPAAYKLARDTPDLCIRIKGNWGDGKNCQGAVQYRVKIIPPQ
jgi:hypothetical protein